MANKRDLIEVVQETLGLSGNKSSEAVNAVLQGIQDLTLRDGQLGLAKFGVFDVRDRAERKGRNMKTGEPMVIPASKVPHFRAADEFKKRAKD